MIFEKTNELLAVQAMMGSGYNRNSAKLILTEVQREHGQDAVDSLTTALDLEQIFGFKAGAQF